MYQDTRVVRVVRNQRPSSLRNATSAWRVPFHVHEFVPRYRFDITDPTFSLSLSPLPRKRELGLFAPPNFWNTGKLNIYPRSHMPRRSIAYKYLSGVVSLVIPREMDAT